MTIPQHLTTIAAIATPPGRGGVGVIRLSGPKAYAIAEALTQKELPQARFAGFRHFYDEQNEIMDEGLVICFPNPHSFTGEDVVELRHAPWLAWIQDLSAMDPWFILPLLMGVTMYVQQMLNPQPADPMQAKVFKFMPIIFTVFMLFFPAGLVLYWIVNNSITILQQSLINKGVEKDRAKREVV